VSRIDAYEYERGPVVPRGTYRRKHKHRPVDRKRAKQESQLVMKLFGGATGKEIKEGEPFDDSIEHIGR
jgi:hypothetical protein